MNAEVKKKWLEYLRSGKYKQIKSRLSDSEGYCCLGVLCEAYKDTHKEGEWKTDDDDVTSFNLPGLEVKADSLPPTKVLNWLNGKETNEVFGLSNLSILESKYMPLYATWLNDHVGMPFEDIATIVENEYIPKYLIDKYPGLTHFISHLTDEERDQYIK